MPPTKTPTSPEITVELENRTNSYREYAVLRNPTEADNSVTAKSASGNGTVRVFLGPVKPRNETEKAPEYAPRKLVKYADWLLLRAGDERVGIDLAKGELTVYGEAHAAAQAA